MRWYSKELRHLPAEREPVGLTSFDIERDEGGYQTGSPAPTAIRTGRDEALCLVDAHFVSTESIKQTDLFAEHKFQAAQCTHDSVSRLRVLGLNDCHDVW